MPKLVISDTQVRQDAEGRYSLNDLHNASGHEEKHQPALFLRLDSTRALADEITRSTEMQIDPIASKKGGFNQGTFVCKELVYAYAMWISPAFSLKVIRAYDALMTQPQAAPPPEPEPEISATLQAALCREAYQLASDGYDGILEELTERTRHYLRNGIPETDILDCLKRKAFGRSSPILPRDLKPLLAQFGALFNQLNELADGGSELYAKRLR